MKIKIDGSNYEVEVGDRLIDVVNRVCKELYMPMNSSESPVNLLTSSYADAVTNTPAYKEASVRMVVLDEVGNSPLPKVNSRFGHPTPQRGV
jgi:formate dehydrogenase major subunit